MDATRSIFAAIEGGTGTALRSQNRLTVDFVTAINVIEAVWWCGLGLALLWPRIVPGVCRLRLPLAAMLIVFGVSDLVEVWSGAWWRPWWLAAIKVACGVAIAVMALVWFRATHGRPVP